MITIFTVPKAFIGEIGLIQKNAILSWMKLTSKPRIILIGTEFGVKEFAHTMKLAHIPNVKKNKFGTPLLSDVCNVINNTPESDFAYINTDIIISDSFINTYKTIKRRWDSFLIVGRRYDLTIDHDIHFLQGWEENLRKVVKQKGLLGGDGWIDYFIFTQKTYLTIPPFAIGRTFWDKWLIWDSLQRKIPVIDATTDIFAVHQKHTYEHAKGTKNVWSGEEARQNIKLAGGWSHGATISEARYRIENKTILENSRVSMKFRSIVRKLKAIFNIPLLFNAALYLRSRRVIKKLGF